MKLLGYELQNKRDTETIKMAKSFSMDKDIDICGSNKNTCDGCPLLLKKFEVENAGEYGSSKTKCFGKIYFVKKYKNIHPYSGEGNNLLRLSFKESAELFIKGNITVQEEFDI